MPTSFAHFDLAYIVFVLLVKFSQVPLCLPFDGE